MYSCIFLLKKWKTFPSRLLQCSNLEFQKWFLQPKKLSYGIFFTKRSAQTLFSILKNKPRQYFIPKTKIFNRWLGVMSCYIVQLPRIPRITRANTSDMTIKSSVHSGHWSSRQVALSHGQVNSQPNSAGPRSQEGLDNDIWYCPLFHPLVTKHFGSAIWK